MSEGAITITIRAGTELHSPFGVGDVIKFDVGVFEVSAVQPHNPGDQFEVYLRPASRA